MEKPDANGYVTVKWPSGNVPYGGIFHSKVVDQSENNRNFLKLLIRESQLSAADRKKIRWEHRLRDYSDDQQATLSRILQRSRPMMRPKTSRRRSQSEIRMSGAYEIEDFRPIKRGEDRDKLKEKLQNVMAYGDTGYEVWPKPPRPDPEPTTKVPTNKDIKNELITQIRERVEWLADMEFLGEGAKHRDIIQDQIAEKLRAMEALGLTSECSTARTSDSGFSTLRSREPLPDHNGKTERSNTESAGKTKRSNTESAGKTKRSNSGSTGKTKRLNLVCTSISKEPLPTVEEDSARKLNTNVEQTKTSNIESAGKTKKSPAVGEDSPKNSKELLPTVQQDSGKRNALSTVEPVLAYQQYSPKEPYNNTSIEPHLPYARNSAKKSNSERSVKGSPSKIEPYLEDAARKGNSGPTKNTARSQPSVASQGSKKTIKTTSLSHKSKREESVHDYEVEKMNLLPSPRRRC